MSCCLLWKAVRNVVVAVVLVALSAVCPSLILLAQRTLVMVLDEYTFPQGERDKEEEGGYEYGLIGVSVALLAAAAVAARTAATALALWRHERSKWRCCLRLQEQSLREAKRAMDIHEETTATTSMTTAVLGREEDEMLVTRRSVTEGGTGLGGGRLIAQSSSSRPSSTSTSSSSWGAHSGRSKSHSGDVWTATAPQSTQGSKQKTPEGWGQPKTTTSGTLQFPTTEKSTSMEPTEPARKTDDTTVMTPVAPFTETTTTQDERPTERFRLVGQEYLVRAVANPVFAWHPEEGEAGEAALRNILGIDSLCGIRFPDPPSPEPTAKGTTAADTTVPPKTGAAAMGATDEDDDDNTDSTGNTSLPAMIPPRSRGKTEEEFTDIRGPDLDFN